MAQDIVGGPGRRILVVDDDAALRHVIQAGLQGAGYRTEEGSSAAEALDLLRTRPYDLIVSDYEMPGGTGLELLERVLQVHPDLPFVLLTGHDELPLARTAILRGAVDFVEKPCPAARLVRILEQAWARQEHARKQAAGLTAELLLGTVRALVAAVDAKEPYTADHSTHVAELALRLGHALDLPAERLRTLEFAALLHDVGKIGVPDSILTKPGKLDAAEWEHIRRHPARSAEIVGQLESMSEIADIVRHHHERMDGNGYPDHLAGEAIPFLARILAVVDVYEALTSDRGYRRAMPETAARDVLRGGAGTHLDAALVEAFLRLEGLP